MTARVSFFWLIVAVSLASTPLHPVPPHLIVAGSHLCQTDNQYPVGFHLTEHNRSAPPISFWKGLLHPDEALG